MVERCPDKTEADGSIPSTLTLLINKKIIFMKIVWSIVLIIVTFALGFYLFTAERNKSLNNSE